MKWKGNVRNASEPGIELAEVLVHGGDTYGPPPPPAPVPTLQKLVAAIRAKNYRELESILSIHDRPSHAHTMSLPARTYMGANHIGTGSPIVSSRPSIKKEDLGMALYFAVKEDDIDCVRSIVKRVENICDYRDTRGYTALHVACENGNCEVVQALLEKDRRRAGYLQCDQAGPSPAILAVENGHIDVLEVLLRERPGWNTLKGGTASMQQFFIVAARNGHQHILDILKDKFREFILKKTYNKALVAAADAGEVECLRSILASKEVNVDYKTEQADSGDVKAGTRYDGDGLAQTALHRCVIRCRSLECAQFLLESKANPNVGDKLGLTPLYYATLLGFADMAKLLLEYGANPDQEMNLSGSQHLPLHVAASNGNTEILQALLKKTTKLAAVNLEGQNCLHIACQTGVIQNIEMILDEGILNPKERDKKGNTPIHCAAASGKLEAVRFLLDNEDLYLPSAKNEDGNTVLHMAASAGADRELVQLLVSKGESIDARNNELKTPLHMAILADESYCAEELCERGADITLRDREGNSPWKLAVISMPMLVQILLDKMIIVPSGNFHGKTAKVEISFKSLTSSSRKKSSTQLLTNGATGLQVAKERNGSSSSSYDTIVARPQQRGEPSPTFYEVADVVMQTGTLHHASTMPSAVPESKGRQGTSKSRRFSLNPLAHDDSFRAEKRMTDTQIFSELFAYGVPQLVQHPVSWIFVNVKWKYYRFYWWIYWLINVGFVSFYVLYLLRTHDLLTHKDEKGNGTDSDCAFVKRFGSPDARGVTYMGATYSFAAVVIILEAFMASKRERRTYLQGAMNWGPVLLLGMVIILQPRHFIDFVPNFCVDDYIYCTSSAAMIGIFMHFVLVSRKNPKFGLYVSLFLKMTRIFLEFLLHYIWILVCSALLLYLLLCEYDLPAYTSPQRAFAKVLIMLNGEFEYEPTFNEKMARLNVTKMNVPGAASPKTSGQKHPIAEVFFILFVLVVSMLLGNLLISLSVNQLQTLLQEATIKRLQFTMELIENLERMMKCESKLFFLSSRDTIAHFLPNDLRSKNKLFYVCPRNTVRSFLRCKRGSDDDDDHTQAMDLEKDIRAQIMEIVQISRRNDLLRGDGKTASDPPSITNLLTRRLTNPEMTPDARRHRHGSHYSRVGSRYMEARQETARNSGAATSVDVPTATTGRSLLSPPATIINVSPAISRTSSTESPDLERRFGRLETCLLQRIDNALTMGTSRGRSSGGQADFVRNGSLRRIRR